MCLPANIPIIPNFTKGRQNMRCTGCDYEIPDGVKFCPICGARQPQISAPAPVPPPPPAYGYAQPQESVKDSPKYVGFGGAIALYFKNYVNFKGRSTRSEYWFAYLFTWLVGLCCWLISFVIPGLSIIAALVFFIPDLSITYRRFHDTGKTGTIPLVRAIVSLVWKAVMGALMIMLLIYAFGATYGTDFNDNLFFLALIGTSALGIVPFAMKIYEIVICCFDSQHEPNKYGREPRY